MHILMYITDNKEQYLGGDPLSLLMATGPEREAMLSSLCKSLGAQVVRMTNGDHLLLLKEDDGLL